MSDAEEGVGHGRRAYDDVIPIVMLQVEERLRETRHDLRKEIAAVAVTVANAQAQASREHAEVRTEIAEFRVESASLRASVTEALAMRNAISELQRHDIAGEAHDSALAGYRKQLWAAAAVVVAALGLMQAVITHYAN